MSGVLGFWLVSPLPESENLTSWVCLISFTNPGVEICSNGDEATLESEILSIRGIFEIFDKKDLLS